MKRPAFSRRAFITGSLIAAGTPPSALLAQFAPIKIGVGSDPVYSSFHLVAHEKMIEEERSFQMAGEIIGYHDAVYDIVSSDASVLPLIEDHSAFFEGPVWISEGGRGHLIFTDIAREFILRWEEGGAVTIVADKFSQDCPNAQTLTFNLGSRTVVLSGPDGLALDREGRIAYCGFGLRHLGRIERDGRRTILAERYGGRLLNSPNDVIVKSDGSIYFTDSSADLARADTDPHKGVSCSGVYRWKDDKLYLLNNDFTAANGLAFSPDERYLYVNDTRRKLIWRFEVDDKGFLGDRIKYCDMNDDPSEGVPDGMKVDKVGNVYCTGPGGLWILSPDAARLGVIRTKERLTNLAFGGSDGRTLFMTGPSFLWHIRLTKNPL